MDLLKNRLSLNRKCYFPRFFLQKLPCSNFISKLKGSTHGFELTILEFRAIFSEVLDFWVNPKDLRMSQNVEICKIVRLPTFSCKFCHIFNRLCDTEFLKPGKYLLSSRLF